MPKLSRRTTLLQDIDTVVSILRTFGLGMVWHSLSFTAKYWRWQRTKRSEHSSAPEFLGDLVRWRRPDDSRNSLDLVTTKGVLRLEFLAPGIVRVRLSRDGVFAPVKSYAVEAPEAWAAQPAEVRETATGLEASGPALRVSIGVRPLQLRYYDESGASLFEDAEGAGWQGGGVCYRQRLKPGQPIYGLGEKAFGLDLRGQALQMWNSDPVGYAPRTDPLYQSIPFLVSQHDGAAFGILFDNTGRAEFDLGCRQRDALSYRAMGGELCYYVLAGPSLAGVLQRYTDLTGHMDLPPRWALGYHQSRWSYASAGEICEVAGGLRSHRIPCDAIHFDIDYMQGYRVFTWDPGRFPDPPGLLAQLRTQGLRAVTILDPGVKADPRYAICREGLTRDLFCRLRDGGLLQGPVWPGMCYFPDFANPSARTWWGEHYRPLLDAGVSGFWNDMNEPALFFGNTFPDAVLHVTESGKVDHAALHNVYGQLMAQAGYDGLRRLRPEQRPFLISRAAYAGIQRFACAWTGDNQSTWEHLRASIPMVLNLGLSGQPFAGPDVGGFGGDCNGELLTRWTQVGACLPLFRNHTALGTARQEPWAFGEPYESICRRYIELRYRLLPYLYTAFWQASLTGLPIARPLALEFAGDDATRALDDEFMLGDSLLVAPVLERGAVRRPAYVPAGTWYDFWTGERMAGPSRREVRAPLDFLPLYARAGAVIPLGPIMQHSSEPVSQQLALHVFPGNASSQLYEDDGETQAYRRGERRFTRFELRSAGNGTTLERQVEGSYDAGYKGYRILRRAREPTRDLAAPWTLDEEWRCPRLDVGMFDVVEIAG